VVTTQLPFSISTPSAIPAANPLVFSTGRSQLGSLNCNNDYLVIPGAFNLGNPAPVADMAFDRFCGERLNALPGNAASTTVCSKFNRSLDNDNFDWVQLIQFLISLFSYCDAVQNALPHQSRRDVDPVDRSSQKRKSWILSQLPNSVKKKRFHLPCAFTPGWWLGLWDSFEIM
jgi:hypothetical protein